MQNRRQEDVRRERLERTKKAIAGRIGRACQHFDPEEFDALVTRAAEIEIKYSMREHKDILGTTATLPPGRPLSRLPKSD